MTGAIAFRWGVLRRWPASRAGLSVAWNALVARSGAWAAGCLLLVSVARLYAQARNLIVVGDPVLPMIDNVLHTTWGLGWMLQSFAALTMLAGLTLARRGSRAGWWLGGASALAITLSPALMGHAVAAERLLVLSVFADWVHVAVAGAWLGSLAMLASIARSASADIGDAPIATLIELFHPVALTSAATLVTTGVASIFLRVDHLVDLLHSSYGAVLAIKLTLTLGVAAIGFYHSRQGARLARLGGTPSVTRSLVVETILAGCVIAATAVLVGTAPPMRM